MKIEELRVGSWFCYGKNNTVTQVFNIEYDRHDGYTVNDIPVDVISGLEITPEILLKAGAINKHGCTYYVGKLKFTYEINELSQFVRFHYSGKVVYLQYVHELQNLYYAICRNELDIKF